MKNSVNIVKYFNAGGANTIIDSKDERYKDTSHLEKVAFDEIQDLSIQKMRDEEVKTIKEGGAECKISIDGTETSVTLSDDLTLEKFKSFLLTKTDNKKFFLEHLLNNDQTLKELKALSKDQTVKVTYTKDEFLLNIDAAEGLLLDTILKKKFSESTKLKDLI